MIRATATQPLHVTVCGKYEVTHDFAVIDATTGRDHLPAAEQLRDRPRARRQSRMGRRAGCQRRTNEPPCRSVICRIRCTEPVLSA